MNTMRLILRYYPDTLILRYPWRFYTRENGKTTGTAPQKKFDALKSSIREHGIINPFIIEHFRYERPNGQLATDPALAIRVGNNRAEAMSQLGQDRGPALFVVPRYCQGSLPDDPYEWLPVDGNLLSRVRELWCDVDRAELGIADAWMDSGLLLDTVRSTLPSGVILQRQERRK